MSLKFGIKNAIKQNQYKNLRSWLFIPAIQKQFIQKIGTLSADTYVVDLEDAVPIKQKECSRAVLKELTTDAINSGEVTLRVNHLSTPWGMDDIKTALDFGIRRIMYPKIRSKEDLIHLTQVFLELGVDLNNKQIEIVPIIETISAYLRLQEIIDGCEFAEYIVFGSEDFLAEMGIFFRGFVHSNPLLNQVLANISIVCAENNKKLIDCATPYFATLSDKKSFESECLNALHLGAIGKLAIHPSQVGIINDVFGFTSEQIESFLRDVKEVTRLMGEMDKSAIKFEDRLVGIPELRKYVKRLQLIAGFNEEKANECLLLINDLKEIIPGG